MKTICIVVLFAVLTAGSCCAKAIPPWYFYRGQVHAAFDGGPLKVLELEQKEGYFVVPVVVGGPDAATQAQALATVMRPTLMDGRIHIEVRTATGVASRKEPPVGDPVALQKLLASAFAGNPHIVGVFNMDFSVLIEARPQILQFFADNLGDRNGLAHFPAAQLIEQLVDIKQFGQHAAYFSYGANPVTPAP